MPAVTLTLFDLQPFAEIDPDKATVMIEDAIAMAARVAPCITDPLFEHDAAARAIIRGAILRWHDSGTGAFVQQQAGPYGATMDTRQPRKGMYWPSEIEQLQELCSDGTKAGISSYDTVGGVGLTGHADICALNFGAQYCSCGAVLTNALYPLYET